MCAHPQSRIPQLQSTMGFFEVVLKGWGNPLGRGQFLYKMRQMRHFTMPFLELYII